MKDDYLDAGTVEAQPAPRTESRALGWRIGFTIASMAAVAWATLHVLLFWRTNPGLIEVFEGLRIRDWSFSMANTGPLDCAQAVLACVLTTALGVLLLRALDVFLPRCEELACGLVLGFGASGVVLELLTMAHGMRVWAVWVAWAAMLGVAWAAVRWRAGRPLWRWWGRAPEGGASLWPELDAERPDRAMIRRRVRLPGGPKPGFIDGLGFAVLFLVLGACSLAVFWNAVFFPETYWDSLILYIGYARMTFLEHAFHFKAEAQVGIGLGANYPHIYATWGAMAATLCDHWTDLPLRFLAPLAGLASTAFIYWTVRDAWEDRLLGLACAVLFAATPYCIAYSTYASDYAIEILLVAAFLHAAGRLARHRTPGHFVLLTAIPAAGMHLNYLMGILWFPWAVAVVCAFRARRGEAVVLEEETRIETFELPGEAPEEEPAPLEIVAGDSLGLRAPLLSRTFWIATVLAMALGSTWLVRNWVLTGNPVYSFYPEIFTRSVRINREVLKSAELEWFRNGDGIARLAEHFADMRIGAKRDQGSPDFRRAATRGDKVAASFLYWFGFETFRLSKDGTARRGLFFDRTREILSMALRGESVESKALRVERWPHAYKLAPLAVGFAPAGALLGLALLAMRRGSSTWALAPARREVFETVLASAAAIAGCLKLFHYMVADFYLYQIVGIAAALAVLAAPALVWLFRGEGRPLRIAGVLGIATIGVVPGLAMSLMNFKVFAPRAFDGLTYSPQRLDLFRHPGMEPEMFRFLRFGPEMRTIDYINDNLPHARILTHENRHLLFAPGVTLVHLDDWDIQGMWALKTNEARAAFLRSRGILHYLRVPNEANHAINARTGIGEMMKAGLFAPVKIEEGAELYRLK